jgi:hypothetical protein
LIRHPAILRLAVQPHLWLPKRPAVWLKTQTSYETSPSWNSKPQNSRIANHAKDVICDPSFEGWFRLAQSCLKLTEFIPSTFNIPCSIFDIFFTVSFPIKLATSAAKGWAEH